MRYLIVLCLALLLGSEASAQCANGRCATATSVSLFQRTRTVQRTRLAQAPALAPAKAIVVAMPSTTVVVSSGCKPILPWRR